MGAPEVGLDRPLIQGRELLMAALGAFYLRFPADTRLPFVVAGGGVTLFARLGILPKFWVTLDLLAPNSSRKGRLCVGPQISGPLLAVCGEIEIRSRLILQLLQRLFGGALFNFKSIDPLAKLRDLRFAIRRRRDGWFGFTHGKVAS